MKRARTFRSNRRLVSETLERRDLLTTFTVTSVADAGSGSLREAVLLANSSPGADVVDFAPALSRQTIFLNTEIVIDDELTIDASSLADPVTLDLSSGDSTPGVPDGQGIRAINSNSSLSL